MRIARYFWNMSEREQRRILIPFHKPNVKEKLFFLISGIVASIPLALFFETLGDDLSTMVNLPQFLAVTLSVVILAPIIEEFGKAYPLLYRHGETQRTIFNLGLLVGLGFGITEFVEYVFLLHVPFYVRIPGVFFHAANTSIVAYGVALRKTAAFYLIAVGLHMSFNLGAEFDPTATLTTASLLITFLLSFSLYRRTTEDFIQY